MQPPVGRCSRVKDIWALHLCITRRRGHGNVYDIVNGGEKEEKEEEVKDELNRLKVESERRKTIKDGALGL